MYVFILPLTPPPLILVQFFFEPPLSDSVFFRQSYITLPPYPSLEWSEKHMQSPPAILHPSSLTYLLSYDIWWGGQGKREEAGGEERKEVAGVGRAMKNVTILKGWKKGKFSACRSEKGGGRQGAGGVRPTPPCPPSHIWKAGCNHFENCVDPSTVIIIKKKWKKRKLENILCEQSSKVRQISFFFLLTYPPPPLNPY